MPPRLLERCVDRFAAKKNYVGIPTEPPSFVDAAASQDGDNASENVHHEPSSVSYGKKSPMGERRQPSGAEPKRGLSFLTTCSPIMPPCYLPEQE